jgi:hypothetical protein
MGGKRTRSAEVRSSSSQREAHAQPPPAPLDATPAPRPAASEAGRSPTAPLAGRSPQTAFVDLLYPDDFSSVFGPPGECSFATTLSKWVPLYPWMLLAAYLELLTGSSCSADAPLLPDIAFTLHGLLGECVNCQLGQARPTILVRGAKYYYTDVAAQCLMCSELLPASLKPPERRVWFEVPAQQLGDVAQNCFAAILYPTTSPGMIDAIFEAAPIRDVRVGHSVLLPHVMQLLERWPLVRGLYLSGLQLQDADLFRLSPIIARMTTLDLSRNVGLQSEYGLQWLFEKASSLTRLIFRRVPVNEGTSLLALATQLRSLVIESSDTLLTVLANLGNLTSLVVERSAEEEYGFLLGKAALRTDDIPPLPKLERLRSGMQSAGYSSVVYLFENYPSLRQAILADQLDRPQEQGEPARRFPRGRCFVGGTTSVVLLEPTPRATDVFFRRKTRKAVRSGPEYLLCSDSDTDSDLVDPYSRYRW